MKTLINSKVEEIKEGDGKIVRFVGEIGEDTEFPRIDGKSLIELVIDLKDLQSMNSCGTRNWVKWIHGLPHEVPVAFVNCPRIFIDHANMFEGFFPTGASVNSVFVPYFCESCRNSTNILLPLKGNIPKSGKRISKTEACGSCGDRAELDIVEPTYFKFLEKLDPRKRKV